MNNEQAVEVMVVLEVLAPVLKTAAGLGVAAPAGAVSLLRRVSRSVGIAGPTAAMLAEESPRENCALFRHVPEAAERLAWRSLGATSRTPIHRCETPGETGDAVSFLVKREDLISRRYGGNKVRTLQHQLAVCEARRESGERAFRQLVSVGTGGSNQVVATVVHAAGLGWDGDRGIGQVNACWFDKDEPDLDNTLNMLSVMSFPNVGFMHNWADSVGPRRFLSALMGAWKQEDFIPMMPGGNCPSGVLGQVSGLLELAEQIEAGECPDPVRIYVPVGSSCTISGLIVGTVLARHLGLNALSSQDFTIVGCNVHDGLALADRMMGLHTNPFFGGMPLTITHTVREACKALREVSGPDVEQAALDFIKTSVSIRSDVDVVGTYGAHSEVTRKSAVAYDEFGTIIDEKGAEAKPLWVCGHFVGKAFAPLVDDLEKRRREGNEEAPYLLWMTKSSVQPRGNVDEWSRFLRQNDTVRKWADDGKAESSLRPGKISTMDGSPDDYRGVMTRIDSEK